MKRAAILMVAALVAACGETDVDGGREAALDTTVAVEPVDLDTVRWFVEGRDVVFNERSWIIAGEPVIDPVVERVGEFEGTPLFAEVNTMPPYNALYVPLEDDYWQMLEEAPAAPTEGPMDTTAAEPADTTPESAGSR